MILERLFNWFAGRDSRVSTLNNVLAVLIIALVTALSFDVLTPQLEAAVELEDLDLSAHSASTSTGNRFNQLFWIALMGLSVYMVARQPERFQRIILAQWPLLLIAALALISVLWALAPGIAFRRSVLLIFVITTIFVGVCYLRSPYQLPLIVYRMGTLALGLNLVAVGLGSFDIEGYFYGIHGHKNVMGAVALTALFFGMAVRHFHRESISRFYNNLYLLLWFGLLLLSVSKTSIGLLFLVPGIIFGAQTLSRGFRLNLGLLMLGVTLVTVLSVFILLAWNDWHIKQFLALFMSDTGFTGRDYIWAFLLEQIDKRWLLGHGYGSFWGIGLNSPNIVHGRGFLTLLNQGHNGYLDLLAKLGVMGLMVYLLVIVQFARQSGAIRAQHPGLFTLCWILLLLTLLHNITESSLLRGSHSLWVIQLLMLALIARLYMDKERAR
ncbi:O-antigen ligase family protein [Ferrimonas sediminicola]|uniref:O-antigen ligase family protein n=1 Tax=Ferrimonas sediminicola TaxID=2569538 RepID=A0A4U1BCI4_9GAMM|nr:O-antigen ligase family protein [Ferrimonas sediminicola]TKB48192.1 O-antigen ligase family protein [Ferrimonas sediminicola]